MSPEFYHEGELDFVKGLFYIWWDDDVFFFFQFFYTVDYIFWFSYVELSPNLWDEAYLIIVDDLSDVFFDLVSKYFIVYVCNYAHKGDWSIILFLQSLCGLGIRVTVAS